MIASPGPLTDLEDSLHHLAPAQQHLAVGVGKFRMLRDEDLDHRAAISQRALQDEMVKEIGGLLFSSTALPPMPSLTALSSCREKRREQANSTS